LVHRTLAKSLRQIRVTQKDLKKLIIIPTIPNHQRIHKDNPYSSYEAQMFLIMITHNMNRQKEKVRLAKHTSYITCFQSRKRVKI